jgi:hypothetical protein
MEDMMKAKILKMEGVIQPVKTRARRVSHYAEDPTARYLLTAENAHGKPMYYFKMQITGMKDRVFGPYARRSMAIEGFDLVLGAAVDAFCEVQNTGRNGGDGMEHPALPKYLKPVPMG